MNETIDRELADPMCLPPEEAAALLRGAPWKRFAVLGDSFAEGLGGPTPGYADRPWADRVVDALRSAQPGLATLNTGLRGLRTAEVRATQLDRVLEFRPDLVHVATGGNDMGAPDLDPVEAEMEAIYAPLRAAGAQIVVFTITNVFDSLPGVPPARLAVLRDRAAAVNDRIRAVAGRHGALLIDMWDHPVRHQPTVMSEDRLHFSRHGHAVLAAEVVKRLAEHLKAQAAANPERTS